MKGKVIVVLATLLFLTGCGQKAVTDDTAEQSEKVKTVTYVENEKILKYDELLLWATNLSAAMAREKFETSETDETGRVSRDYGYAKISFSDGISPKIVSLEMVRPNLACPRGIFLGNPVEKIEAYYHSAEDEYGDGLNYYFEDVKDKTEKYSCSSRDGNEIVMSAASKNEDGTFSYLELKYEMKDEVVESIVYTSDFEKGEEETRNIFSQAKEEVLSK